MEGEEGAWDGRLCKEIGRERVDVPVVQKPPSEVAATADEVGTFTWAVEGRNRSNLERREGAGNHWSTGRREQREGGEKGAERGRGEGWDEVMG